MSSWRRESNSKKKELVPEITNERYGHTRIHIRDGASSGLPHGRTTQPYRTQSIPLGFSHKEIVQ